MIYALSMSEKKALFFLILTYVLKKITLLFWLLQVSNLFGRFLKEINKHFWHF